MHLTEKRDAEQLIRLPRKAGSSYRSQKYDLALYFLFSTTKPSLPVSQALSTSSLHKCFIHIHQKPYQTFIPSSAALPSRPQRISRSLSSSAHWLTPHSRNQRQQLFALSDSYQITHNSLLTNRNGRTSGICQWSEALWGV